jgi:4-diphosphocytidyl-2-C-methyl-D-erythritol kinase
MSDLPLRALAPAKINLGLWVGPVRNDGRHELVSVMQSISLADELWLEAALGGAAEPGDATGALGNAPGAPGDAAGASGDATGAPGGAARDEVVCPGVPGPPAHNLAARALAAFRAAASWDAPPLRLSIDKRIPLAAGLGGGSADAAAALRLAVAASGLGDESLLLEAASELGADVPAQVRPGRWLATGAGERLEALPDPVSPFGVLVLPVAAELSSAAVYAELDRLGGVRSRAFLEERRRALHAALDLGMSLPADGELLHNDLQDAARSLCPAIGQALDAAREAGADAAFVSGSGPTVVGLFGRANGLAAAGRAAADLEGRIPAPLVAAPVGGEFAAVSGLSIGNN